MAESSPSPSLPPSEPRPASRSGIQTADALGGGWDRPARLQMIAALLLGLVLVTIPLYLWRRPRAEAEPIVGSEPGASSPALGVSVAAPPPVAEAGALSLGEPHIGSCQDPGSKKTAADQCDRLPVVEKALARAIEDSAGCVPDSAGGGTIVYVADVSFARKKAPIVLTLPKDGRSLHNAKAIAACTSAVKQKLVGQTLDGVTHAHARYHVAITATYPGPVR